MGLCLRAKLEVGLPTHHPVTQSPSQTEMDSLPIPDILHTYSASIFTAKGAVTALDAMAQPLRDGSD
jgi:membrane-bound lytic murein transglycosylase B